MSRFRIRTNDFVVALSRHGSTLDLQCWKFGDDYCYPLIDRDRGPTHTLPLPAYPISRANSSAHDIPACLPDKLPPPYPQRVSIFPIRQDKEPNALRHLPKNG